MSSRIKWLIGAGIFGIVALTLVVGGVVGFWLATSAVAQASAFAPASGQGSCHDNQSVFQLLDLSEQTLLAQRQAGKSLLEIAQAKGVGEDKLMNALLQPMNGMHGDSQANLEQMTQGMRDQFAKDIRDTEFGTMTDYHLGLGNTDGQGMMGGANTSGMMGNGTGRGMMGRQSMMGK